MNKIKALLKAIPFIKYLLEKVQHKKKMKQFYSDFNEYSTQNLKCKGTKIDWSDRYICLNDRTATTGFDAHYIYHPAWAARIMAKKKPTQHVDISSSLSFVSIVSAFISVRFYDYRPADLFLDNLTMEHVDILDLPFSDNSIPSLSCMHVVEHIGLGRYGDPIDSLGDVKAIQELKRVLMSGGDLLFVVPIGEPKVAFNAHRIYSYDQIMEYFSGLELIEFSLVPDDYGKYGLIKNATKSIADEQQYGCGCFWFRG